MSLLYQRLDFTLKPPRKLIRKIIFTRTVSRLYSKSSINDSKSSWHWLNERYNVIRLHRLCKEDKYYVEISIWNI